MATAGAVCYRVEEDGLAEVVSSAHTLDDLSQELPRGVYTALRTYPGGRALHVAGHLRRLEQSANLLGRPLPIDVALLRRAMAESLRQSGFPLARLRLTVALDPPGETYVALAPFTELPEEVYRRGTRAVTTHMVRTTPLAKDTRFIELRAPVRAAAPADAEEVLLVDPDESILEGTTSNYYAVLEGRLRTAGEGVLEGITRAFVLALAQDLLPVDLRPVHVTDLPHIGESFVTSASRGVLPLVTIDGMAVGAGVPGPVTNALRQRYLRRVEQELEPLDG